MSDPDRDLYDLSVAIRAIIEDALDVIRARCEQAGYPPTLAMTVLEVDPSSDLRPNLTPLRVATSWPSGPEHMAEHAEVLAEAAQVMRQAAEDAS